MDSLNESNKKKWNFKLERKEIKEKKKKVTLSEDEHLIHLFDKLQVAFNSTNSCSKYSLCWIGFEP